MMLNQPHLTVEPRSAECLLASAHATTTIPAAWHTPLPARTEITPELKHTGTTTTLLSNSQPEPEPTALHALSRKTKIIATLGPAMEDGDVLRSLLEAGVSVFRVNLTCLNRESVLKAVYAIRSISTELQRPVALLLDLQLSPGRAPDSPAITESEWADIRFGLEAGVDWLAISAGRDGDAVRQRRQFFAEQRRTNIGILARIKNPSVMVARDQILQEADGIILEGINPASEGSGAETFRIVQKCRSTRKLVVMAAGLNSDVTSILAAYPDAWLLSAKTSLGSNPLRSVQMLDRLIRQEEANELREAPAAIALTTEQDKAVAAAVQQANKTVAEAIVVLTRAENSAALCAALRPLQARVFVFTPDARLARRLCLRYALETVVIPFSAPPKATLAAAERVLRERKLLAPGAKVVFITDPFDPDQPTSAAPVRTLGVPSIPG
jgi:pyruvate kinase